MSAPTGMGFPPGPRLANFCTARLLGGTGGWCYCAAGPRRWPAPLPIDAHAGAPSTSMYPDHPTSPAEPAVLTGPTPTSGLSCGLRRRAGRSATTQPVLPAVGRQQRSRR
jgi:hypothetical protein